MMKVLVVLMLVCSVQSVSYKQQCLGDVFDALGDIDDIKLELKCLKEKNKEQAAKLDTQEDQLKEQAVKQVAQQTDFGNLKKQLQEQAVKLDKQEDQLKEQSVIQVAQQTDAGNLKRQLQEQSVKQVAQQTDVGKLKKQLQGEQVAFAASLSATARFFGPYNGHTPMVFKHVFTNIGNAYSPVTGRFTAPRRGAYHFECHIFGGGVKQISAWLMKNSEQIFFAYQYNNQPLFDSASNSVTLLLKAGDVVYMRQQRGTKVFDSSQHRTTFSGHLLFSM